MRDNKLLHIGNLEIKERPETEAFLQSITGVYPIETNDKNWWHWTEKSMHLHYRILGSVGHGEKAQMRFTYMPISKDRAAKIIINNTEILITMNEGWNQYVTDPFEINNSELSIEVSSLEPPQQLSKTDKRHGSFLAGNFELILLPKEGSTEIRKN